MYQRVTKEKLLNYYFDKNSDREIFMRASKKCYIPTNRILLNLIDQYKNEKKKVKVAFSLSGVFLEQCELFNKDVLESFKQLAETGCVEFLGQTYYHSLCSLFPITDEFIGQVKMHRQIIQDLLGVEPRVFENTELLYNNTIAKEIEKLDYDGIYLEGAERILNGKSPNNVYEAKNCKKLRVLLRNYKLTDDIGFRFSTRDWKEWPLTADKYSTWLTATPGQCINIFPDYETFGEHHWPETGIQEFLSKIMLEILKHESLELATPSEAIKKHKPIDTIDVPEFNTVSWADLRRDTSGWLGNTMQWAYYSTVRDMEGLVKESQNLHFINAWRYFQISDHLYYMFTGSGAPSEVHDYFSPFGTPTDAFITCQSALMDFEMRLRSFTVKAKDPFRFYKGVGEEMFTGMTALSLKGFIDIISKVEIKSVEFHKKRGDFVKWAKFSLQNKKLTSHFRKICKSKLMGEPLKIAVKQAAEKCFEDLRKKTMVLGYY